MKLFLILFFLFAQSIKANDGVGLLLKNNKNQLDLSSKIIVQKQLSLDNSFKVQLFSTWKASRIDSERVNQWIELVLNDQIDNALYNYPVILNKSPLSFRTKIEGVLPYLLWKKELYHSFFNAWLNQSINNNYLVSELGLALDHFIGYEASSLIIKHGLVLTHNQKLKLEKIENQESKINYTFQAWKNQRRGEKSLKWISRLPEDDPLRIKLLYTVINDYSSQGKLALSGQLIKKAIEPYIEKTTNVKEISYYYLTLARLLYQARAFEMALNYYALIPEQSQYFLQSKVEQSWAYIHLNKLAEAKAQLSSLDSNLFADHFLPDVYLTSSIVNLKTCQFEEVQKNISSFINSNSDWAKRIDEALAADSPERFENNIYLKSHDNAFESLDIEKQKLKKLFSKMNNDNSNFLQLFYNKFISDLSSFEIYTQQSLKDEIKAQWINKKRLLNDAIDRFKFVRIEFLSQMRNLALNIPLSNTDKVSTYSSAPKRANDLEFPNDGQLWGDDLFHMRAKVKNLCLRGKKSE